MKDVAPPLISWYHGRDSRDDDQKLMQSSSRTKATNAAVDSLTVTAFVICCDDKANSKMQIEKCHVFRN